MSTQGSRVGLEITTLGLGTLKVLLTLTYCANLEAPALTSDALFVT